MFDIEKMKAQVVNAAIVEKKRLSDSRPSVTMKMEIWERSDGRGENRRHVFKIAGKEFEADDNSLSTIRNVSKALSDVCKSLNEKRGYLVQELRTNYWYQVRDMFGYMSQSCEITIGLTFLQKPCKEFELLRRYLRKYAGIELKDLDLYSAPILGKRGTNYGECGERDYYAHNPRKCTEITSWIVMHRKSGCRLVAKIGFRRDCKDEEYSLRYETESYGTLYRTISLRFVKNGKTLATKDFSY